MSKATYPLKLSLSIKKATQRLAKEDGVSLKQWIAVAVAEKVGVGRNGCRILQEARRRCYRRGPDEVPSHGSANSAGTVRQEVKRAAF